MTNSGALYDVSKMNVSCGEDRWLKFSPKLCREQDGWLDIPAHDSGAREIKAYRRKKMIPKRICVCNSNGTLDGKFVPAAAPHLNLIEYWNGFMRTRLWDTVQSGEEEWKGSPKNKKGVLMTVINSMNEKPSFFRKLYKNHQDRCRKIISEGGDWGF